MMRHPWVQLNWSQRVTNLGVGDLSSVRIFQDAAVQGEQGLVQVVLLVVGVSRSTNGGQ